MFIYNINKRKIEQYNVFDHFTFVEYLRRIFKRYARIKKSEESFANLVEEIRREVMYYFWGKVEWEIAISPLFDHSNSEEIKIDVSDQIFANFDQFIDYCIKNKKEILESGEPKNES